MRAARDTDESLDEDNSVECAADDGGEQQQQQQQQQLHQWRLQTSALDVVSAPEPPRSPPGEWAVIYVGQQPPCGEDMAVDGDTTTPLLLTTAEDRMEEEEEEQQENDDDDNDNGSVDGDGWVWSDESDQSRSCDDDGGATMSCHNEDSSRSLLHWSTSEDSRSSSSGGGAYDDYGSESCTASRCSSSNSPGDASSSSSSSSGYSDSDSEESGRHRAHGTMEDATTVRRHARTLWRRLHTRVLPNAAAAATSFVRAPNCGCSSPSHANNNNNNNTTTTTTAAATPTTVTAPTTQETMRMLVQLMHDTERALKGVYLDQMQEVVRLLTPGAHVPLNSPLRQTRREHMRARFWDNVVPDNSVWPPALDARDQCMVWCGSTMSIRPYDGAQPMDVRQFMYVMHVEWEEQPQALVVRAHCPCKYRCVNPRHLVLDRTASERRQLQRMLRGARVALCGAPYVRAPTRRKMGGASLAVPMDTDAVAMSVT